MLYRAAGIRHTRYQDERRLWPYAFDRGLVAVVAIGLLAAPWLFNSLQMSSYVLPWVIWSTAALGLNLLMGGAGQIHLGYAAVMAIGAYTSVHAVRLGLPFEIALILSGFVAAAIGTVFGSAALRIRGLYLAVATLAMQYIVDFVIGHVPAISGGTQAAIAAPAPRILGMALRTDIALYYLALAVCAVVTIFSLNVRRTSFGRALAAIREKDFAAEILGVSAFRFKLSAFWTSSFIGGIAGSLLAFCYYRTVTPEQFHIEVSIQLVAMVIVGGLGSVLGSFFGAGLILLAPLMIHNLMDAVTRSAGYNLSTDFKSHAPLMIFGALIVGFLLIEPLGLAKMYDNVRKYFLVWPFRHMGK
ncbi:MAG: branched-chain amino acid ABC transporter permease [Bradyrhizobiaceae bacterium PARB1]|jgi:branched-chain amino acid transport system permease protein|nr:MAG: branched-chain amino acid ABC transporter permease [Bradyrhizobiaceae bacterium PARB1]